MLKSKRPPVPVDFDAACIASRGMAHAISLRL
jgi:hypothetical protein